jgi:nucleotide-binding universal stress UspA family protein
MALVPDPAEAADVTETTAGERAAREIAEKAVASLSEASPPEIIVRTVIGSPADELIDASAEADLLVVGNRGSGGFARLLLGSASTQVVHHAHCPVVVVPPADARPG